MALRKRIPLIALSFSCPKQLQRSHFIGTYYRSTQHWDLLSLKDLKRVVKDFKTCVLARVLFCETRRAFHELHPAPGRED